MLHRAAIQDACESAATSPTTQNRRRTRASWPTAGAGDGAAAGTTSETAIQRWIRRPSLSCISAPDAVSSTPNLQRHRCDAPVHCKRGRLRVAPMMASMSLARRTRPSKHWAHRRQRRIQPLGAALTGIRRRAWTTSARARHASLTPFPSRWNALLMSPLLTTELARASVYPGGLGAPQRAQRSAIATATSKWSTSIGNATRLGAGLPHSATIAAGAAKPDESRRQSVGRAPDRRQIRGFTVPRTRAASIGISPGSRCGSGRVRPDERGSHGPAEKHSAGGRSGAVMPLALMVAVVLGDAGVVTLALPEILRDFGAQVGGSRGC